METIKNKQTMIGIKNASKTLGIGIREFFERAVSFYLYSIKDSLALKKEFDIFDKLSDEAFLGMKF